MLESLLQFFLRLMPKSVQNLWAKYENIWRYCYYGAWTTVVSGVTKLIGKCVFSLFGYSMVQTVPNLLNTTVSWIITASFAFYVNKKYVFMSRTENRADLMRELGAFFGARGVSFFMELGLMWLTTAYWKWNYYLMVFLVQFIILAINYIFSKLVVFRKGAANGKPQPASPEDSGRTG